MHFSRTHLKFGSSEAMLRVLINRGLTRGALKDGRIIE